MIEHGDNGKDRGRRFELSVFWQVLFWVSLLVIITQGATVGYVYKRQEAILETQLSDQGSNLVRNLSAGLRDAIKQNEFPYLRARVEELVTHQVVDYAMVLDSRGIVVAHNRIEEVGRRPEDAATIRVLASRRHAEVRQQTVFHGKNKYREFFCPVFYDGSFFDAFIRIGYRTEKWIDEPIRETQARMMWIFFVAVLGAIGLSVAVAHPIVQPIRVLARGAESIAAGNYDEEISVSSPRELRLLGGSFNHMRVKVQEQLDEIREANHRLDRKVYELGILYEVARKMNFKSFSPELLNYLLDTILTVLEARWASLMMLDDSGESLKLEVVRGAGFDKNKAVQISVGAGIAGKVFQSGEGMIANEGSDDERFEHYPGLEDFEKTIHQIICVPLMIDNQPIGVINVVNRQDGTPFNEDDLRLLGALASQAARALENAKLYDLAIRESKTGLFIPRYFEARIREEVVVSKRYGQKFCVVMVDIDHFKQVNDRHGHLIGDEALIKLAHFITETLRENIDIASRFGGEEFAVLLPRSDLEGGVTYAERLRKLVEERSEDASIGLPPLTISLGVACFPLNGGDFEGLMKKADDALYEAKRTGRNRVCAPSA